MGAIFQAEKGWGFDTQKTDEGVSHAKKQILTVNEIQ